MGGLSKRDSSCIKGFAIILMLFHHLFNDLPEYDGYPVNYAPFSDHRLTQIALLSKICVALFVFVTGYGLTISYRLSQERGRMETPRQYLWFSVSRWWGLMSKYWFVFALVLLCQPLGRTLTDAYGAPLSQSWRSLVLDFFALGFAKKIPQINPTFWYMTLAIWFLFLVPLVNMTIDFVGVCAASLLWTSAAIVLGEGDVYCQYLVVLLVGIVAARAALFEWIDSRICTNVSRILLVVICGISFCLLMIWRLKGHLSYGLTDGLVALVTALLCRTVVTQSPVGRVLSYLGDHSTNMFLFHTMLYSYYFLPFFYGFHYWWLITAVLVVVSLLVGLCIEWVEEISGYNRMMHGFALSMESVALGKKKLSRSGNE